MFEVASNGNHVIMFLIRFVVVVKVIKSKVSFSKRANVNKSTAFN